MFQSLIFSIATLLNAINPGSAVITPDRGCMEATIGDRTIVAAFYPDYADREIMEDDPAFGYAGETRLFGDYIDDAGRVHYAWDRLLSIDAVDGGLVAVFIGQRITC